MSALGFKAALGERRVKKQAKTHFAVLINYDVAARRDVKFCNKR